ncbi:MAG TPA: hypothetical protein PKN36_08885 [bacterium]|nr:hypothetical protein [bacterium]
MKAKIPLIAIIIAAIFTGCAGTDFSRELIFPVTVRVELAEEIFDCDIYIPDSEEKAPLVILTHGFSRSKSNMSGWGTYLSGNGFAAVVPDLPGGSDHQRNGRAINGLIEWIDNSPFKDSIDTGLITHS